jgi:glycosyltransferase involved in cell wall biosynthesis
MNILFASTSLPHGLTSGGEVASQAFVEAMRKAGHFVQVFGFARTDNAVPPGSVRVAIRAVESSSAGLARYGWLLGAILAGRPFVSQKFSSARYVTALRNATRLAKADVLVLDHAQMGWLLPWRRQFAKATILIAHNHEASLYAGEAAREVNRFRRAVLQRDGKLLDRLERRLAAEADQIWTLSASEQAAFAAMADQAKVSLVPLAGRPVTPRTGMAAPQFDIGLLGTWAWAVNGRGLDWFVDAVMPLLPAYINVCLAGRGSDRVAGRHQNLSCLGFVADPVAFMHAARVLAVPTRSGAGVQLKTIEAIASGTPLVSTTLGVRGLAALPDYVAVENDAEAFAAALLRQMHAPAPHPVVARAWVENRRAMFEETVAEQLGRLTRRPTTSEPALEMALT